VWTGLNTTGTVKMASSTQQRGAARNCMWSM